MQEIPINAFAIANQLLQRHVLWLNLAEEAAQYIDSLSINRLPSNRTVNGVAYALATGGDCIRLESVWLPCRNWLTGAI